MHAATPGPAVSFPATQWSLVLRAGHGSGATQRQALDALLRQYLPAMRAHLLASRLVPPGQVEDLLQGFVADKVVERGLVSRACRQRGKFRTFVAVSLDHYVVSRLRFERSTLRAPAGGTRVVGLCGVQAVDRAGAPHDAFNRAWAAEVVSQAQRRMRQECASAGRDDVWTVFHERLLAPTQEGAPLTPYADLAARLGLGSEVQAANLLVTAKRQFGRVLRSVVAEYVGDEALVDQEIEALMAEG